MLTLAAIDPVPFDWQRMEGMADHVAYASREWIAYLATTQRARPVVAAVRDGTTTVGYFTGLVTRRFGITILGSPFPGWATPYMGFHLEPGVPRREALRALQPFAFGTLHCQHLEVRDRHATLADAEGLGYQHAYSAVGRFGPRERPFTTYVLDLRRDEDAIFRGMSPACRRAVRKGQRDGVEVESAAWDDEAFATDYHAQLTDVFARQDLAPPWGLERIRTLLATVGPSGRLLLLRARTAAGAPAASGIFLLDRRRMYLWSTASHRDHHHVRPNEAVFWAAARHARRRGLEELCLGGGGDYKRKYGVEELAVPILRRSRPAFLSNLRDRAGDAVALRRQAHGRLQAHRAGRGGGRGKPDV